MNKKTALRTALLCLAWMFAAHAFAFFNLSYAKGSVSLRLAADSSACINAGQYLLPFYALVRGNISAPLLVGMLSTLYIVLAAVLLADLLALRSFPSVLMLCGILCVNPAMTSLFAASLHTADASLLAMLLSVISVHWTHRCKAGLLPGILLLAAALAFDPIAMAFTAALLTLCLVKDLLCENVPSVGAFLRSLLLPAISFAVYFVGEILMLRRSGLSLETTWQLRNNAYLLTAWLYPLRQLFMPFNAYPILQNAACVLLLLAVAASLLSKLRQVQYLRGFFAVILLFLLPLLVNLPVWGLLSVGQTSFAFVLLPLAAIMLIEHSAFSRADSVRRICAGLVSIVTLGGIVFANQVSLKTNLVMQSTLSAMSRVLTRIEASPDFTPGSTPVALIGTLAENPLMGEQKGFSHLSVLEAASDRTVTDGYDSMVAYAWSVLGYPLNFVSEFEQDQLAERAEIQDLPAFPAVGCTAFVDGVLCVKLSD